MNQQQVDTMDPHMLMSIVNSQLRSEFDSLEQLVRHHDLDEVFLVSRLKNAGYRFDDASGQFREVE